MSVLFAVFIGIIQGLAEFLPVSSSGHLNIIQNIFGIENVETNYFSFDILLHLATLIAVFIVFRHEILKLIIAFFTLVKKLFTGKLRKINTDERMVVMLVIATLPLGAAVFIKDYIEAIGGYTKIVGAILIFNGVMLFVSDLLAKGGKNAENAEYSDSLVVGVCQVAALLPGLSRSGTTITAGLARGFDREYAVKFSFLLSIPAVLGANIMNIPELMHTPVPQSDLSAYFFGMLAALVTGIIAMKLLVYIAKRSNFRVFAIYCAVVGTLAVIFGK